MIDSKFLKNFTEQELEQFLTESSLIINKYSKNLFTSSPEDVCDRIRILKSGKLSFEEIDTNGKNTVVSIFKNHGKMIVRIYSYLNKVSDFTLMCNADCEILEIPVGFFDVSISSTPIKSKIMTNLITILAKKAFFLNSKVGMLSNSSLRQKIITFLIQTEEENISNTGMTKQRMADFLTMMRPSLSRELLSTEDSDPIELNGSEIKIKNREESENSL